MSAEAQRSAAPSPRHGYTAAQVRAAEAPLLAAGQPLMQRAAAALADEIGRLLAERARETDGASRPRIVVLAGSGDNGGDALFAAAQLASGGADVRIVATGSRLHEEAAAAAHAAGAHDLDPGADPEGFDRAILDADVILDGILGIGAAASPVLRGRSRDVVAHVLALLERGTPAGPRIKVAPGGDAAGSRRPLVVAVDLPSGISPDDGSVPDPTVLTADVTLTFGAVKAGLLVPPGRDHAGRVALVDLGLGPALQGVEPAVRMRDGA